MPPIYIGQRTVIARYIGSRHVQAVMYRGENFLGDPAPGYSFSNAQAAAFVARSSSPVSDAACAFYDIFFSATSDILAKLDAFYLLAAENRIIAKLNLVQDLYNLTENNPVAALSFTVNRGFSINAPATVVTSGMTNLSSGMATNIGGTKFSQSDASMGSGGLGDKVGGVCVGAGTSAGTGGQSFIAHGVKCRLTSTASKTSPVFSRSGHAVESRTSSASYDRYQNGIFLDNTTHVSSPPAASIFTVGNAEYDRTYVGDSDTTTFAFIGGGLSSSEILRLYYATNSYLAAIGAESLVLREVSATAATATSNLNSASVVTFSIDTGVIAAPSSIEISDASMGVSFASTLSADLTTAAAATTGIAVSGTTISVSEKRTGVFTIPRTVSATAIAGSAAAIRIKPTIGCFSTSSTVAVLQPGIVATAPPVVKGVNLSAMEFSGTNTESPFTPPLSGVDYYAGKGFNCIRLPHRWSRLQHSLFGALDISGTGSGDAEKYKTLVDYITITKGMYCIIDPHDYAGRLGLSVKLGDQSLPLAAYEDYCTKLIQYLGTGNTKIIFCLVNEPSGIAVAKWAKCAQSLIYALRAAGFKGHIHVPGGVYTGAHSWVSSGNAAALAGISDPLNNFAYEVHQYLDSGNSGTESLCTIGGGSSRLSAFLSWLAEVPSRRAFLGEFAANPALDAQCGTELPSLLAAWQASSQTVGWAAWGGGQYWKSDYMFRIEDPVTLSSNTSFMTALLAKL